MFLALLLACSPNDSNAPAAPPPSVAVVSVHQTNVPVESDLRGRVEASRTAEVRARVDGIVLERTFTEGQQVEAGDVLFRIDPAPLRARLAQARAEVARSEAALKRAKVTADRLQPLAGSRAVSAQDLDNANADLLAAQASVQAARAAADAAGLDLDYATVTAPISGRIGRALVTEGALVSAASATQLATIVQLDPVFVNLSVRADDLRAFRRSLQEGSFERTGSPARVVVRDDSGWRHPFDGELLFADVTVDPQTGSTLLRATVPNPEGQLLPGMFVRATLDGSAVQRAITVPQQAVVQAGDGASVFVVDGGIAHRRPVELSRTRGNEWVLASGLVDGEVVVAEGLQRTRDGAPVSPVEWSPVGRVDTEGAH